MVTKVNSGGVFGVDAEIVIIEADVSNGLPCMEIIGNIGPEVRESRERVRVALKNNDIAITLSLGEKSYDDYAKYKDFGADRYLLRIETTDKDLYKSLHPHMSFENRVECLKNVKKLVYQLGTGSLIISPAFPDATSERPSPPHRAPASAATSAARRPPAKRPDTCPVRDDRQNEDRHR